MVTFVFLNLYFVTFSFNSLRAVVNRSHLLYSARVLSCLFYFFHFFYFLNEFIF